MNGIELKCLRENLNISAKELASLSGLKSDRTVRYWEAEKFPVPDDVQNLLLNIEFMKNTVLENYYRFCDENKSVHNASGITLVAYPSQVDYEKYVIESERFPYVRIHRTVLWDVKTFIEEEIESVCTIVLFNEDEYQKYLSDNNTAHDLTTVSRWAVAKNNKAI